MNISVLLVDDQAIVRSGFRAILESQPDLTVAGEAADGEEALRLAARLTPDIVLMDIRMPRVDGLEATRRLVAQGIRSRVVVITTFEHDEYVFEAVRAGASGFLLKDVTPEGLVDAIRIVHTGEALLAPAATRMLLREFAQAPARRRLLPPELDELTQREREVLQLVARGLSNADIARAMHVGESTVKTHVGHMLMKLGLANRIQAVVLAYESGLVLPGVRD